MSPNGTSRHFAAARQFGRIWSEADINDVANRPLPRFADGRSTIGEKQ